MQLFGIIIIVVGIIIALATVLIKIPVKIAYNIKSVEDEQYDLDEDEEYSSDEDDFKYLLQSFSTIIKIIGLLFVAAGIVIFLLYL